MTAGEHPAKLALMGGAEAARKAATEAARKAAAEAARKPADQLANTAKNDDQARAVRELRRLFEATGSKRRRELRRVIDAVGGERRSQQLANRLRELGDEVLANQLDFLLLEYRKRSARPRVRWREKKYGQDDWLILRKAEDRARLAPDKIVIRNGIAFRSRITAFEIIRETVRDAIATGAPAKPRGASEDAIVRRLYSLLRPRKEADLMLPFKFPALQSLITPYRRSNKGPR